MQKNKLIDSFNIVCHIFYNENVNLSTYICMEGCVTMGITMHALGFCHHACNRDIVLVLHFSVGRSFSDNGVPASPQKKKKKISRISPIFHAIKFLVSVSFQ